VSTSPNVFREYRQESWNFPTGLLNSDQTNKLRFWGVYDIINNSRHNLNVSLLQNFFSGTPYGAVGSVDSRPFVTNPGYASPPSTVGYFFTARDAFRTEDVSRTDIAMNYTFRWSMFGKQFEVFIQPEVINLFDETAVDARNVNQDVLDATNDAGFEPFDPFTQTPVRGPAGSGANWDFGEDFGDPIEADDFQTPRTFRFSVGFRF